MSRRVFGIVQPRYNKREWSEWQSGARKKKPRPNRYRAGYEHPNWTGTGRPPRYYAKGTFATVAAADAWLAQIKSDIDRGHWVAPDEAKVQKEAAAQRAELEAMTLETWCDLWLEDQKKTKAPGSIRAFKSRIKHITKALGKKRLIDVTTRQITRAMQNLEDSGTRHKPTGETLSAILNAAVDDERTALTVSPFPKGGVRIKANPPKETYLYSVAEIDAITAAITPEWRALIVLLADAGLRINEALALTRAALDLDSERPAVIVTYSLSRENRGLALGNTKTKQSRRRVLIEPRTVEALKEHLAQFAESDINAPVFPNPRNRSKFMRDDKITPFFDEAKAAAGVVVPKDMRSGFHALRHYSATRYGQAGASLNALMSRYGWSEPDTAMRYQRADEAYEAQILEAMADRADRERSRHGQTALVVNLDTERAQRGA